MPFKVNNPGCPCCEEEGCTVSTLVTVGRRLSAGDATTCGVGATVAGVSVVIRRIAGNAIVASGTTDAAGQVLLSFDEPSGAVTPGLNYRINVSKARWAQLLTTDFHLDCDDNAATVWLGPAATHVCCAGCSEPIKRVLILTDFFGSRTFTYSDAAGKWRVCFVFSDSTSGQNTAEIWSGTACISGNANVAVAYELSCPDGSGRWGLVKTWSSCSGLPGSTKGGIGQCLADGTISISGIGRYIVSAGPYFSADMTPGCIPLNLSLPVTSGYHGGTVTITE